MLHYLLKWMTFDLCGRSTDSDQVPLNMLFYLFGFYCSRCDLRGILAEPHLVSSCLCFRPRSISTGLSPRPCRLLLSRPFCHQDRPKSALELLCSSAELASSQTRGRMSAEEQLERMKRHQRALVRERKRNLSQGEPPSCTGLSSSGVPSQRSSSSPRLPSNSSDPLSSVRYAHPRAAIADTGSAGVRPPSRPHSNLTGMLTR